jgi:hypothetical protein
VPAVPPLTQIFQLVVTLLTGCVESVEAQGMIATGVELPTANGVIEAVDPGAAPLMVKPLAQSQIASGPAITSIIAKNLFIAPSRSRLDRRCSLGKCRFPTPYNKRREWSNPYMRDLFLASRCTNQRCLCREKSHLPQRFQKSRC